MVKSKREEPQTQDREDKKMTSAENMNNSAVVPEEFTTMEDIVETGSRDMELRTVLEQNTKIWLTVLCHMEKYIAHLNMSLGLLKLCEILLILG